MEKKSGWLLGCGLGCAGLLALVVITIIWGISLVRDSRRGYETAEKTRGNLEAAFGAPGAFVPAADGTISPARMEIFLAVREATQESRTDIARFFSTIPTNRDAARQPEDRSFGQRAESVFGRMNSAVGMGKDIGRMFEIRNQSLLDRGMGTGEYTYIYVLAYNSWLGHPPGDGPARDTNASFVVARFKSRMHRDLTAMLSNQLESAANAGDSEEWNRWRSGLADEIEKMKMSEDRVPWENSLPAETAESLEPFRGRLEQTYNPLTNPFELSLPGRQDLFSFGGE